MALEVAAGDVRRKPERGKENTGKQLQDEIDRPYAQKL
jgi:hypothetical protein